MGQLLGFSCYDDDDVLLCLILGRFPSPLLLWYPRISSAIFKSVLCTTADHRPPQIPRVMSPASPSRSIARVCGHRLLDARSPGRTDGLPDRRPTSRATCRLVSRHLSIFLATQFNHVQKYGDRFYDFSVLILSFWLYIAAKKKKKRLEKKLLSHIQAFFSLAKFRQKMTKFIFYSYKMKWFWKVSIGNRSEGEKIARFLCLVFSV